MFHRHRSYKDKVEKEKERERERERECSKWLKATKCMTLSRAAARKYGRNQFPFEVVLLTGRASAGG